MRPRPLPRPQLGNRDLSRSIGTGRLAHEEGAFEELYEGVCLHEFALDGRPFCGLFCDLP